jgi:hypothetical protein
MKTLIKNVVLFFLAPFIGLAYVFAVPLVATLAIVHVIAKSVFNVNLLPAEMLTPLMVRK